MNNWLKQYKKALEAELRLIELETQEMLQQ